MNGRNIGRALAFPTLVCAALLALFLAACAARPALTADGRLDYSRSESWVELPKTTDKPSDVFFVLPVVDLKDTTPGNEDVLDPKSIGRFRKTLNMEKGIVSDFANVFAPLYRQQTLGCYLEGASVPLTGTIPNSRNATYAALAYQDVRDAFKDYLHNRNGGRPFVLFGFSQGAEMVYRLVAEFGNDKAFSSHYVAAYAIGMPASVEYVAQNPTVRMAQRADDTGVVISYNAVDERALAKGIRELSINPLNWQTDSTLATRDQNRGFVLVDKDGKVTDERKNYCGAYLDKDTGRLVVSDMEDPNELYDADNAPFAKGDYHLQDLSLFYRNLQENVQVRIDSFAK